MQSHSLKHYLYQKAGAAEFEIEQRNLQKCVVKNIVDEVDKFVLSGKYCG